MGLIKKKRQGLLGEKQRKHEKNTLMMPPREWKTY